MEENFNKSLPAGQATPPGTAERLRKPLALELKKGCGDSAVSGGLEAYIKRWAPDLASKFKGYPGLDVQKRKTLVSE
ncbi:MAG: hypothetical protein ACREKE_05025, partial [bacterium]